VATMMVMMTMMKATTMMKIKMLERSQSLPQRRVVIRAELLQVTENKNANNSDHNKRKYHRVFLNTVHL
jgi:hypothetical protein